MKEEMELQKTKRKETEKGEDRRGVRDTTTQNNGPTNKRNRYRKRKYGGGKREKKNT